MSLSTFLQQCLTGISLGGAYALIAIGYTLVYGILRLINFAHGDIFMMAGYFMTPERIRPTKYYWLVPDDLEPV